MFFFVTIEKPMDVIFLKSNLLVTFFFLVALGFELRASCLVNNIEILHIFAGKGHNNMYWKLLNNGRWEERSTGE
jgi:hypothetical protein